MLWVKLRNKKIVARQAQERLFQSYMRLHHNKR